MTLDEFCAYIDSLGIQEAPTVAEWELIMEKLGKTYNPPQVLEPLVYRQPQMGDETSQPWQMNAYTVSDWCDW